MKGKISIFVIMAMAFFLPSLAASNDSQINASSNTIVYRVDVDQDYGFYRVIDTTTHKPAPYENNTLTIRVGDTIIWINDATPDEPLTIISMQGLWNNTSAKLRWNYQKFSYTFNQSGTYEVYIKEYPREQHQIIIIKDIIGVISLPTTTYTISPTMTTIKPTTSTIADTTPIKSKEEFKFPISGLIAAIGLVILIIYLSRKRDE